MGNWNTSDFSDEDMDQDVQQDIAAAAAQSVGIDMGGYDFGGYDPSGTDFTGVSNKNAVSAIANSFMADPNAAARTAMAIRQSYPAYSGNMRPALNSFINRYTTTRGPLTRAAYNSAYDITRTNLGGINTLGYDTAKALQRIGIGSGQVKSADPTAGRLTGTVFKDGVISKDGVMQGVSSDVYYGAEDLDNKYEGLPRYSDKGYLGPDGVSYSSPEERALSRAYDQYMNPYNKPGELGYNPDVKNIGAGEVRPGLQSGIFSDMSGTPTKLGPVATYDRNYSGMDNLAMTAFGGMGHLARALTNKVTGIEGQALPAAAMAPTPEMIAQGQTYGGFSRSLSQIPGQIKQGIESFITPNVPAPTPTSIGTPTSALNSWSAGRDAAKKQALADAVSSVMSQAQTSPSIANMSLEDKKTAIRELAERNFQPYLDAMPDIGSTIVDGKNGFQTETLPDGSVRSVQTTGGMTKAEADEIKNNFENTKNLSAEEAAARAMERLENSSYNFFTDPQAGGTYPSAMAGEQLAGLFGENPKAAGFRDLGGMIKSVVDGENLPDNQNMYGPGMPDQTPLTPDELNDILAPSGMELGRGPSTANQYAQVDYSNLTDVGGNIYQAGQQKSAFDSFLEAFGMKEAGRRPSGQIYSPAGNNKPFFDNFGFGQ